MFDEGSPKESHKLLVAIGVAAALALFVVSHSIQVVYRVQGREIVLNDASGWATAVGLLVMALLIAWHRGWIADAWPFVVNIVGAALVLLFLVGDWYTAWSVSADEMQVSRALYVAMVASVLIIVACALGLRMPIRERSESQGQWSQEPSTSRARRDR